LSAVDWQNAWKIVKDAITSLGWAKGILTLFFWVAHAWIYREYRGRLNDRQKQIDMIAAENREYRERLTGLLDQYFKPPQALIDASVKVTPPSVASKGSAKKVKK